VRFWSRRVAMTSAALFYCVVFVQDLSSTARIDLATTFFATLAFGCLLIWQQERRPAVERCAGSGLRRAEAASSAQAGDPRTAVAEAVWSNSWLWLSAAMVGVAVATKWTAVPVVALPAFVFLVAATRSFRLPSVFCLLTSIFVVPWLVKNWVLAGNPVYPLLTNVWPSPYWSPAQAALFAEKHYSSFDTTGWLQLGERLWRYSFLEMNAGPLLLMTAPLVLLVRRVDATTRRAGWLFVAAYASWWLLTFRPWRFLFPAFPLAAMVAGWALHAFDGERWVRWAIRGTVGLVLGVGLSLMAFFVLVDAERLIRVPPQMSILQYALGHVGRDEFVARMGKAMFEPIVWMNKNLPPTAKVLYLGEARVALARHAVVWATAYDQHPLTEMTQRAKTEEELLSLMRERGITHVYINFSELQRLSKSYGYLRDVNWPRFRTLLEDRAEIVHESGRGVVYTWRSSKSP
jgi:4-amino-4-deoxy-L-arabinose transferase-like glycosyltransferase